MTTRPSFFDAYSDRVLVFDGAMGTSLQAYDLTDEDFDGLEGCNEILVDTRPDIVKEIHRSFLEAGADVIETNSFGSNSIVLGEYNIAHRDYELSRKSAELAREVDNIGFGGCVWQKYDAKATHFMLSK